MTDLILPHFATGFVIVDGVPKLFIWAQSILLFGSLIWSAFFGILYMSEQFKKRIYEEKGELMPRPKVFKRLRDYLRGGEEYYAQTRKETAVRLQLQSAKRGALLFIPTLLGLLILVI